MVELNADDLLNRLKWLDRDASLLFSETEKFNMVIVGGGALVLMGYTMRATHDIDVISASYALFDLMNKYDMNVRVKAYENNFPHQYEDRIKLLWAGESICFYTASLEDIVVAKLYASRPNDKEDFIAVAPLVDWEILEYLALNENEVKKSALNERNYLDFLYDYGVYKERYRP